MILHWCMYFHCRYNKRICMVRLIQSIYAAEHLIGQILSYQLKTLMSFILCPLQF